MKIDESFDEVDAFARGGDFDAVWEHALRAPAPSGWTATVVACAVAVVGVVLMVAVLWQPTAEPPAPPRAPEIPVLEPGPDIEAHRTETVPPARPKPVKPPPLPVEPVPDVPPEPGVFRAPVAVPEPEPVSQELP